MLRLFCIFSAVYKYKQLQWYLNFKVVHILKPVCIQFSMFLYPFQVISSQNSYWHFWKRADNVTIWEHKYKHLLMKNRQQSTTNLLNNNVHLGNQTSLRFHLVKHIIFLSSLSKQSLVFVLTEFASCDGHFNLWSIFVAYYIPYHFDYRVQMLYI